MIRRTVAEVVALTGADWRSLMAMSPEMFKDVVTALQVMAKAKGDG